ncbi:hypothetical protein OS493_035080 [Desmophyllum pertusum]|uniref:Apple domain-containing protein n=1 Tax=Desmophyllum pertusum TaxID=174260 RepID=A0A9W9ZJ13_9CNID|nr:hypothetical protein OS493_035080 [Desmophyllum pertusum]
MEILSCILLLILVHKPAVFADRHQSGVCRDNREEFGYALVGHDFRTVHADNFGRCFFECSLEERCQSVTYLWNGKECKMNKETKKSRPEDFVENPAATYMENNFRAKKGSTAFVPGSSCKDIVMSGDAQGDGGWTHISRFIMKDQNSMKDQSSTSNSYRTILSNYHSNKQYLLRNGFNQLKNDMGFTQIRFYCFKKETGRVFHIMTNKNTEGADVVKFFTESDTMPTACGSFTRLPDDNSSLAVNCDKWGFRNNNRWGHQSYLNDKRLFSKPIVWQSNHHYQFSRPKSYFCDDISEDMSLGDTWQIFVR